MFKCVDHPKKLSVESAISSPWKLQAHKYLATTLLFLSQGTDFIVQFFSAGDFHEFKNENKNTIIQ